LRTKEQETRLTLHEHDDDDDGDDDEIHRRGCRHPDRILYNFPQYLQKNKLRHVVKFTLTGLEGPKVE
jgi:hypothetical protein